MKMKLHVDLEHHNHIEKSGLVSGSGVPSVPNTSNAI